MADLQQQLNQAVKLHQQGHLQQAIDLYKQLIEIKPNLIQVYKNLFTAYLTLNDTANRIETLKQWIANDTNNLEPRMILAQIYANHGEIENAKAQYQQAIKIDGHLNQKARVDYGTFLLEIGEIAEGRNILQNIITENPKNIEAMFLICHAIHFESADDPLITTLKTALENNAPNPHDQILLHFSLGKAYDDIANYDEAFSHYQQGNNIQKDKKKSGITSIIQLTDHHIQTFTPKLIKKFAGKTHTSDLPVFVVGMPRSGTSMLEQILAAHPEVSAAGELKLMNEISDSIPSKINDGLSYPLCIKDLTPEIAIDAAESYVKSIEQYRQKGTSRVVDKMPGNFWHVGFISCLFNNAKIIHIKRNPIDTCLSNYFQCFSSSYTHDLTALAKVYRQYQRITEHWKSLPLSQYIEIEYESLLENFEENCKALISFIGLKWDARCLNFKENKSRAPTPSSWQVHQPIYKSSMNRWENYKIHLDELVTILNNNND